MVVVSILLFCLFVVSCAYYRKKVGSLGYSLSQSLQKLARIEEELEMYKIRVGDLNNIRKEHTEKNKAVISSLNLQLDQANQILEESVNRYEKKIENLNENNKRLSTQLINAGSDIRALRIQIEEKDKINNSLVEANNDLMKKYASIKKVNSSLVSSAGGYEKSNIQLRESLEEITEKYNANVDMFNSLKEEYDKVVAELEKYEGDQNNEDIPSPEPDPEVETPKVEDTPVDEGEKKEDDPVDNSGSSEAELPTVEPDTPENIEPNVPLEEETPVQQQISLDEHQQNNVFSQFSLQTIKKNKKNKRKK